MVIDIAGTRFGEIEKRLEHLGGRFPKNGRRSTLEGHVHSLRGIVTSHGVLADLLLDQHTQYALLAGRASSGQTLIGGPATAGQSLKLQGDTVSPVANASAAAVLIAGTLVEAGSGTHPRFAGLELNPPTITAGAAALTDAATLYISAAPTGATNNYAAMISGTNAIKFLTTNAVLKSANATTVLTIGNTRLTAGVEIQTPRVGVNVVPVSTARISATENSTLAFSAAWRVMFFNLGTTQSAAITGAGNGIFCFDFSGAHDMAGLDLDQFRVINIDLQVNDSVVGGINSSIGGIVHVKIAGTADFANTHISGVDIENIPNPVHPSPANFGYRQRQADLPNGFAGPTVFGTDIGSYTGNVVPGKVDIAGSVSVPANANGRLIRIAGVTELGAGLTGYLVEAASGTHARLMGIEINAPTVTAGVATVTDTATVYVSGAMSATVTGENMAVWVDAGKTRLDGDLDQRGTNVGFYGVTPVARPSAYTQTYATADKTHANFTSADLAAFTGGTVGFLDAAERDNIRTQFNALRADVADVKQLANAIIDDLQSEGLLQ